MKTPCVPRLEAGRRGGEPKKMHESSKDREALNWHRPKMLRLAKRDTIATLIDREV